MIYPKIQYIRCDSLYKKKARMERRKPGNIEKQERAGWGGGGGSTVYLLWGLHIVRQLHESGSYTAVKNAPVT
jgi:hypothetical protein